MANMCFARVSSDGWHFHKCGRKAVVAFLHKGRDKATPYCGIHARKYADSPEHKRVELPEEQGAKA